ncbi:MAG: thioredoxin family protein [Gemmataceae bacterium]
MLLLEYNWRKEVLESEVPVLVHFWGPGCPPCRAMEPYIETLANDFKVCKANTAKNHALAAHYGVSAVPTLMIFQEGEVVFRHVGLLSEAELRSEMEKVSQT